jgi:hypothetical protein
MAEAELTREIATLHLRLDALRMAQQHQQTLHFDAGYASRNPAVLDRYEDFSTGLDDMQDDRGEFAGATQLAQLHERMHELQQAREQEQQRGHEHGMGL